MYPDDTRKPNSNECVYNGRKLSNTIANVKAEDWPEIDLEDVLIFSRKYCNGIFERILKEIEPYKR